MGFILVRDSCTSPILCCVAVLPAASMYGKERFFLLLSSYLFLMYQSRSIYELAPMTFDFLFLTWYHGVFVMAMFCVWNPWRVSCLSVLHCSLLSPNYSGVLNLLIFFPPGKFCCHFRKFDKMPSLKFQWTLHGIYVLAQGLSLFPSAACKGAFIKSSYSSPRRVL